MKEFDLEKAKAGHPVCTRDGKPARILCFDRIWKKEPRPIIALVEEEPGDERVRVYKPNGKYLDVQMDDYDLMMAGVKKEGWTYLYRDADDDDIYPCCIFDTEEEARKAADYDKGPDDIVAIAKIEWEE